MLLTAWELNMWMREGQLKVEPLLEPIQPASIDLRLGDYSTFPAGTMEVELILPWEIAPSISTRYFRAVCLGAGMNFLLVSTLEWIEIGDLLAGVLVGQEQTCSPWFAGRVSRLPRSWLQGSAHPRTQEPGTVSRSCSDPACPSLSFASKS
jgi:hypothetical protein